VIKKQLKSGTGLMFVATEIPVHQNLIFESENQSGQIYPASKGSVFSHESFNLTDDTIQFVNEIRVITMLAKRGHKSSVIPDGAVFLSTEPLEYS